MIYFDNSATTNKKPKGVVDNMMYFLSEVNININRGAYSEAFNTALFVLETKELIGKLFNFKETDNIVFTPNITYALNFLIQGLLTADDHVLVSSFEHNATMRTLNGKNISFTRIPHLKNGEMNINNLTSLLTPNTKALIISHVSNVTGNIQPLKELGIFAKENNLILIVDAAQSAGILNIDMEKLNIDALAFTGHKALLGPMGIGGFLINDKISALIKPIMFSGTGSNSTSEYQPNFLPDMYELGTPNIPAIYGLNASLKYLMKKGLTNIYATEMKLTHYFLEKLKFFNELEIIGKNNIDNRLAVISLNFIGRDNNEISYLLDDKYKIITRAGYHCSPHSHKAMNTFKTGTVRFSLSHFNTIDEIDYTINAIGEILCD